jgi:hypothetical protein
LSADFIINGSCVAIANAGSVTSVGAASVRPIFPSATPDRT